MSHYPNINYDEFFTAATDFLRRNLPAELSHFTTRRNSKNNWIVIEYPNFKYSQYELHLSSHSGNHAVYFGDGPHVVCAFYFKIKKEMADCDAWLETLSIHIE